MLHSVLRVSSEIDGSCGSGLESHVALMYGGGYMICMQVDGSCGSGLESESLGGLGQNFLNSTSHEESTERGAMTCRGGQMVAG